MKIINKIYCWFFKHDSVAVGTVDDGRSVMGAYKCLRCGHLESWQYDK